MVDVDPMAARDFTFARSRCDFVMPSDDLPVRQVATDSGAD
jgi:hypothetical protein